MSQYGSKNWSSKPWMTSAINAAMETVVKQTARKIVTKIRAQQLRDQPEPWDNYGKGYGKPKIRRKAHTGNGPRYCIRVQCRAPYNPKVGRRSDWRAWRRFMVWPITFTTPEEAQEFMDKCFTFRNINGRKPSACISRVNFKPAQKDRGRI